MKVAEMDSGLMDLSKCHKHLASVYVHRINETDLTVQREEWTSFADSCASTTVAVAVHGLRCVLALQGNAFLWVGTI